ncbi:efflux transporter periplasmic adaptor subunit [Hydrogenophaga crassostreae]|uniref:Efflux transporter periplasmic adaptor subunit n=1 Tax=Hydrogenophaga crassostreae TaxID=1763535 RepID=A0A162SXJ2_9BURK|nr:efflux RND transporter periplasmic adaptor subunit [Hydrogenophaga crassostreae]AOW11956.1 efflux transporter periplasmic adaptor subunit [Hydrogenophaga crassostreae]OAD43902.1 efflux transporter periplasmic adaptor subunit [Hydrogenophaga crassostreae]
MTAQKTDLSNDAALQNLLGEDPAPRWWKRPSLWLALIALILLVAGWTYWQSQKAASAAPAFVTEVARKGQLTLTVSANGTLQPTRSVNIGSELSGTVQRVLVDVNDKVKAGQVMVELDAAKFKDQVQRSRASLAAAQAQMAQSSATVKESRSTLARFEEVAKLSDGKVPSATELDSARAAVARAEAAEQSALANVAVARATLSTDETNLSKSSIRSPIDGVVLSRSVDPGNAVAASLQAVTLFTVAENLAQLELSASVDEADVGSVQVGQKASFTVSAYPSRKFPAAITRVAFGSTTTNNVVTYTATLAVDNDDLSLRPGMTAVATIVSTERNDALLVPNTALRFTPTANGAAKAGAASSSSILSKMMPRPPRSSSAKKTTEEKASPGARTIWVLVDGSAKSVAVQTGISDGRMTEIVGGDLQPGMQVITDQRSSGTGS